MLLIILIILVIFWIIATKLKEKYNNIHIPLQRNTILYWFWIVASFYLSKIIFNNYWGFPIIFIGLLIIHEILWYIFKINITKDEGEVTNNFYRWGNIYCDNIKDIHNLSGTDLTEGLYSNNWNLSNKEALLHKYDTYFNYLKLKSGMDLLDIGCGNCTWLNYCKKRGVNCTGITITHEQANFCKRNGINNIIVGDIHKNILTKINKKFDAISNIGAMEHFSTASQSVKSCKDILNRYYSQVKKLIKKNSSSGRYLNSIMTNNSNYSDYNSWKWNFQYYIIASCFGYGWYPPESFTDKMYNSKNSKIIIKRDCTEVYRRLQMDIYKK